MTQVVSGDLIYKMLLPPIVLAEGFNIRKRTIGKFGSEILSVGVIIPLMTLFALTMTIYGAATIAHLWTGEASSLQLE